MGVHRQHSEDCRLRGSPTDSPERPTKRRKVQRSKPLMPAMEFWAVSYDSPSAHAVPVDPWLTSTLIGDHDLGTASEGVAHARPQSADLLAEGSPVRSPGVANNDSLSLRSSSRYQHYQPRTSPFVDCRGIFGAYPLMRFSMPKDGQVNGYLKVREGARSSAQRSVRPVRRTLLVPEDDGADGIIHLYSTGTTCPPDDVLIPNAGMIPDSPTGFRQNLLDSPGDGSPVLMTASRSISPASPASTELSSAYGNLIATFPIGQPQLAMNTTVAMDEMGLRLWNFYMNNFIPGRSIMARTNLWQDFAGLAEVPSVVSAIQSYMGLYIYDFTHSRSLAHRINHEFNACDARLSELLACTQRSERDDSELITLIIILAMQDVVLPERRRKLPHQPRWIHAALLAEEILDTRQPGALRSWIPDERKQLTHLQIAHNIMVGRSLILSQPMTELQSASHEQLERQQYRFQWLLYGDVNQIHGGCGFSPKLMHTISKITWLVACQASNLPGDWTMYAEAMLDDLRELVQINPEGTQPLFPVGRQPIENIRLKGKGYTVETRDEMVEVSAEAWRIMAIAYLQCRFWRLPRNHPEVVSTIEDLAHCVRILPTSGYIFTAQAPLLPVFFLGLLGTTDTHRNICRQWVKRVLTSPIRSSVPPLHRALRHAWNWISDDPLVTPPSPENIPSSPEQRVPWWEYLVRRIQQDEQEIPCLT